MDNNCIFCKIIKKELESKIIYEDQNVISFLDINPHTIAHTVVIPKKHYSTILDLSNDDILQLFSGLQKVVDLIKKTINPDGFNIGINHGRVAGQVIDHLHIHVLPRFFNDGGGSIHSIIFNKPKESLDEIYEKIKKYGNRS
ncbi:MAG: HIT family protein [Patescibacteria group bacterium]|nr:HIT family protein [Patescibacteria group bacterium]MCX7589937.1 HIT family protein [Patescibacteria group bacterium]MDW8279785.1 HIT family protein [bacterium]